MFAEPASAATHGAFSDLSGPALAVQRATESGCGVLSVGRSWVQFEGWVLKEAGLAGGWHLRYFVVSGDRLEYFKEEKVKLQELPTGEPPAAALAAVGIELDHTNVVSAVTSPQKGGGLTEGDVIIGVNGEAVLGRRVTDALAVKHGSAASSGTVTLTVLRPKGRIALLGATVAAAGHRKQGGHVLTISVNDSSSRRSRYNLVCAEERLCAGWVASIKEAVAAAQMEEIKTALSQALQLQALSPQLDAQPATALPTGAPASAQPALQRSASATDATLTGLRGSGGDEIRSALGC